MPDDPTWERCRAEYAALQTPGGDDLTSLVERARRLLTDLDGLTSAMGPAPDVDAVRPLAVRAQVLREFLSVGAVVEGDPELAAFRERLLSQATMAEIHAVLEARTTEVRAVDNEIKNLIDNADKCERLLRLLETYLTLLRTVFDGSRPRREATS